MEMAEGVQNAVSLSSQLPKAAIVGMQLRDGYGLARIYNLPILIFIYLFLEDFFRYRILRPLRNCLDLWIDHFRGKRN